MVISRIIEWLPHVYRPRPYPGVPEVLIFLTALGVSYTTIVGVGAMAFGDDAPMWFVVGGALAMIPSVVLWIWIILVLLSIIASLIGRDMGHRTVMMEIRMGEDDE